MFNVRISNKLEVKRSYNVGLVLNSNFQLSSWFIRFHMNQGICCLGTSPQKLWPQVTYSEYRVQNLALTIDLLLLGHLQLLLEISFYRTYHLIGNFILQEIVFYRPFHFIGNFSLQGYRNMWSFVTKNCNGQFKYLNS